MKRPLLSFYSLGKHEKMHQKAAQQGRTKNHPYKKQPLHHSRLHHELPNTKKRNNTYSAYSARKEKSFFVERCLAGLRKWLLFVHTCILSRSCIALVYNNGKQRRTSHVLRVKTTHLVTPLLIGDQINTKHNHLSVKNGNGGAG